MMMLKTRLSSLVNRSWWSLVASTILIYVEPRVSIEMDDLAVMQRPRLSSDATDLFYLMMLVSCCSWCWCWTTLQVSRSWQQGRTTWTCRSAVQRTFTAELTVIQDLRSSGITTGKHAASPYRHSLASVNLCVACMTRPKILSIRASLPLTFIHS